MKKDSTRIEVKEREEIRTGVYDITKNDERTEAKECPTNEQKITNLLIGRPFNIRIY